MKYISGPKTRIGTDGWVSSADQADSRLSIFIAGLIIFSGFNPIMSACREFGLRDGWKVTKSILIISGCQMIIT